MIFCPIVHGIGVFKCRRFIFNNFPNNKSNVHFLHIIHSIVGHIALDYILPTLDLT